MKLHVDLETLQLIEGPGFRNPVTALRFKRGDSARLEVAFLEGGSTAVVIGDPAQLEIRFGIKPRNRYDVSYLVHSAEWTMPDPGAESPVYSCSPSFNTVELDSALGVGSSTGTELSEITLMGEITWREGAGEPTSTRTFLVIVENDVNRGTEGVPTDADPAYPAPDAMVLKSEDSWFDARFVRHDIAQTPLNAAQRAMFMSNFGAELPEYYAGYSLKLLEMLDDAGSPWLTYDGTDLWFQGNAISSYVLYAGGYLQAGYLYDNGSTPAFDIDGRTLFDSGGMSLMDWSGDDIYMNKSMVFGPFTVACDYFTCYDGGSMSVGVYDSFPTSDGRVATVSGGIITDIS